ncbi:MAG: hypothetical protein RL129_1222, partial [Actinomycetota bacterium]
EVTNITKTLSQLHSQFPNIDILHIDDNSPDGTAEIAQNLGISNYRQIRNFRKNGLGSAYKQGIDWAIQKNYDFLLAMDSDGSHHVEEIQSLLTASQGTDLVIGTRWMPGGSVINWPWYRKAISKFGTRYAKSALKLPFSDLTSGFRIYRVAALKELDLSNIQSKGYVFQIEMAAKLFNLNKRITEVPITFTERSSGKSKMTSKIALEAFIWCTKARFKRK